ncbi:MAG: DNA repair protein RadA [Candidatus Omnitrophota bacterium]|nr:MAG: DNA repair protein RadA [Candidatus Omnitrophota bacterium]
MFSCANCGYQSVKWLGKCPLCGAWESFSEQKETRATEGQITKERQPPRLLKDIGKEEFKRVATGIDEFDRILGGGVVRGEMILIGGEPGVGKSTLLLEVASRLSQKEKTLYVSAEESSQQISLRAKRLKTDFDNLYILGEDDLQEVYNYIKEEGFKFMVIDSIQVVQCPIADGSKGTIGQIRGCADYLTQIAKSLGVVIFVVGHVTKEGALAGPKLLEHIVDCVLYFEGEIVTSYRILKATKNRFGATGDIAVFEMTSEGLREIKKINDVFLPHKNKPVSGSSVVCVIEGLRPILIELQSLVSRASFGVVRRRSLGFDFNRFSLLVAIIEKRLRLSLSSEDVFLNVAGGLRINDTAADLGAVVAIVSSFKEKDIPAGLIFIGEVGLSGELRRVNNINLRLKSVERAGFNRCIIPEGNLKEVDKDVKIKVEGFGALKEIIDEIF